MTTATITPAKLDTTPAKGKASDPVDLSKLKGEALTKAVEAQALALRARYIAADKGEADARHAFEVADIAWQNARVAKVRVAYAAAMLTPNKGEANLLAATRYLLTDPADTPAKRTSQAKSRKNTLRPYVAAGAELQAKGLANRITEPDEEERKIVAAVFREHNKREKAEAKGYESPNDYSENGESGAPSVSDDMAPANGEALTVVDIVGHIGRMHQTFNLIKASGVVISELDAGQISEMLATFTAELEDYSAGK